MAGIALTQHARLVAPTVFLASAVLMVLRGFNLLLAPRFLAEEGRDYYAYAYHHGFLESMVYVYPKASYLNLVTNLVTALSAHTAPPSRCHPSRYPSPPNQAKHLSDRRGNKLPPSAGAKSRFVGDPMVTVSTTMSAPAKDQHTSIVAGSSQPR